MNKTLKRLTAMAAAVVMSVSMAIAASAASTQDVLSSATNSGVPDKYVAELNNYLLQNPGFNDDDRDYMVSQLSSAGSVLGGKTLGKASSDEKEQVKDILLATASTFGVEVTFSGTGDGVVITASKATTHRDGTPIEDNTTQGGSGESGTKGNGADSGKTNPAVGGSTQDGAAATGAQTEDSGLAEGLAVASLALAGVGTVVLAKANKKVDE